MVWMSRKKVPRSTYDTLQAERDAFEREVARLRGEIADLVGKYTTLGFDEALERGIASEAITLLQQVKTRRTVGVALQRKIDDIAARAGHLGLVPEKREEKEDATSIQAVSQDDSNGRAGADRS